jgi:FMN phosphatase YigB (HAD superfamily)
MKIYKIPEITKAFIFDIDSTLYTNQAYAFEQIDCQLREYATELGVETDVIRKKVSDYRKKFASEHNGSKVSLGNTLLAFGIPIEKSIEWRNKLMRPQDFLKKDTKLIEELKILSQKCKLICVTNNPVRPARKTLEAIGISEFFPEIIGLDTCKKSKPAYEPFNKALEILGVPAKNCIAVGDRYEMDIAIPLELGMGGILVTGVEEVYKMHELI